MESLESANKILTRAEQDAIVAINNNQEKTKDDTLRPELQDIVDDFLVSGKTELNISSGKIEDGELEKIYKQLVANNKRNTITNIYCRNNKLTSLPPLPDSLKRLSCGSNKLTSLPTLPSNLQKLGCNENELISLPSLPDSLELLNCDNNNITALPTLPNGLTYLYCYDNNITALPALPNSLKELYCDNNLLTQYPQQITARYENETNTIARGLGLPSIYHNHINTQQGLTDPNDPQKKIYQLVTESGVNSLPFGKNMEIIMNAVDQDQKQQFVQYQLVNRSSMISKAIGDGYDRYLANEAKAKKAYGPDYDYTHAVYPLIDFATTPELISLLGNHDLNKNYSFNKSVNTIRERIGKETPPNNNPFTYIDNLKAERYNDETKTFLKEQLVIGLLLKANHHDKLTKAITEYGKDKVRGIIQKVLDTSKTDSLRYNYMMQGLSVLHKGEFGMSDNISHWFKSKTTAEKVKMLILAKLDAKGGELYSTLKSLASNISESDIDTVLQSMGGVEIDYHKTYNDVMFLYVGDGHGGGQERIVDTKGTIYRCPAEQKLLQSITTPTSGKTLAQTQSKALFTLKTTGNVTINDTIYGKDGEGDNKFDVEDLGGNNDNYRKSEILRYAEERGFDTIAPECLGLVSISGWETMGLIERQSKINEVYSKNNYITLMDNKGVRTTFVMYSKITPEQKNKIFTDTNPDFACVRGHTGQTDPAINGRKDKRPASCTILDGGCRNAFKMDGYQVPNNILAYTATARACTTLYTADIVIDHMRRLRSEDQAYQNKKHQRSGLVNEYNTNEERKGNFYTGADYKKSGYQSYQGDYTKENIKLPGFDIQKVEQYTKSFELFAELSKKPELTTIDNSLIQGKQIDQVDSKMDRKESIGRHILHQMPKDPSEYQEFQELIEAQRIITVPYYGFDGKIHSGQIIVHKDLVIDTKDFFTKAFELHFPIHKVVPISHYKGSDNTSMADNNTSGFNYREITGGGGLSNHAYGKAFDINPIQNPYFADGQVDSSYDQNKPGVLSKDHKLVKLMIDKGYTRGGNRNTPKDYQHFEKK